MNSSKDDIYMIDFSHSVYKGVLAMILVNISHLPKKCGGGQNLSIIIKEP